MSDDEDLEEDDFDGEDEDDEDESDAALDDDEEQDEFPNEEGAENRGRHEQRAPGTVPDPARRLARPETQ